MTKSVPFTILAAAAMLSGGAAFATTAPVKQTHAAVTTHTAVKKTTTTTRPAGARLVTVKTANGKSVTYDCSKAGNATKAACKR